ncbi:MAG: urease accessory protein UreG [Actinobacteria bacterium]|nr:urease accessory protein UreG [Actinomycetota bacterium]
MHPDRHATTSRPTTRTPPAGPLRVGIGGPVGSGKTAVIAGLCAELTDDIELAVVTNDIFTTADADALRAAAVLPTDRIVAVETGCCPHTAVRDDVSANLDAVEQLIAAVQGLELVLIESGGDNLTLTWSRALVDRQVFVIDVAAGDDIPFKGGPGITSSDLLIVNKVDLAPHVGADLERMRRDAERQRGMRPTLFTAVMGTDGVRPIADWVREQLTPSSPTSVR